MVIKGKIGFQNILGGALILIGILLLLEKIHIISGAAGIFWGILLLIIAGFFLVEFARHPQDRWWAIIPAMALLGMSVSSIIPAVFSGVSGGVFLDALGLAFFIVYFTNRARWWGIIPGGVLVTLGIVTQIGQMELVGPFGTGGIFFLGLGITFLLVALLPNPSGKMQWAYIPALVMIVMGALAGSQAAAGLAVYIWPAILIISGLAVLARFFMGRD